MKHALTSSTKKQLQASPVKRKEPSEHSKSSSDNGDSVPQPHFKRRHIWRQKLVDVERGMTQGFRADSTFFVHFFTCSMVIVAALVMGISLAEWTVLVLALSMVLSAQMFNQVLKTLWQTVGHQMPDPAQRALKIGTAAVFVALSGAVIAIGLIFGRRLHEMFGQ